LELYHAWQATAIPEVDQATRVMLQMVEPGNGSGGGCSSDYFLTSFSLSDALLT